MTTQEWTGLRYFKPGEFTCKCGCGRGPSEMDGGFVLRLDRARGVAATPFIVTSGYRCEAHNRAVGGVPKSAHTLGVAADVVFQNGHELFDAVLALISQGMDRFVFYPPYRIHVDADQDKPAPMMMVKAA